MTNGRTGFVIGARYALLATLAAAAALGIAPSIAQAGAGAETVPTFPNSATVGQTNVPAALILTNGNTGSESFLTNNVCNAGEPVPCSLPEEGILLTPTCTQIAGGECTPAGADPGVFRISPLGLGRAGTACGGVAFTTTLVDATFGKVRFTPQPPGTHVQLSGRGATCLIDFTFDVLKLPADRLPALPGNQTAQAAASTQCVFPCDINSLSGRGLGTSGGVGTTVVLPPPPPPPEPPRDKAKSKKGKGKKKAGDASLKVSDKGPCAGKTFELTVPGKKIDSVKFYVDGRLVAKDTEPKFSTRINTRDFKVGTHRIRVVVEFASRAEPAVFVDRFFHCDRPEPPFTGRR